MNFIPVFETIFRRNSQIQRLTAVSGVDSILRLTWLKASAEQGRRRLIAVGCRVTEGGKISKKEADAAFQIRKIGRNQPHLNFNSETTSKQLIESWQRRVYRIRIVEISETPIRRKQPRLVAYDRFRSSSTFAPRLNAFATVIRFTNGRDPAVMSGRLTELLDENRRNSVVFFPPALSMIDDTRESYTGFPKILQILRQRAIRQRLAAMGEYAVFLAHLRDRQRREKNTCLKLIDAGSTSTNRLKDFH